MTEQEQEWERLFMAANDALFHLHLALEKLDRANPIWREVYNMRVKLNSEIYPMTRNHLANLAEKTPDKPVSGLICECSNPRCFEPLGITREQWSKTRTAIHIAPTCKTKPTQENKP